ncbi:MAG: anthranilate synthase component I [Candidatus Omnitrophota bacterium]|nr:anthranilate synthase component I [Candidatus Omnitrophota bacterium]
MLNPSFEEFLKLSKRGNVIPVYKEINADLDTPVSAFLKLKKNDYAFLFESVEGQEKIARFSFLGTSPALVFKSKGRDIEIYNPQTKRINKFITKSTPLDEIKKIMKDFKAVRVKGLPRFWGGLVGYFGYDVVRFFEEIPDKNADDLKLADSIFILTRDILIFDHVNHKIKIVVNVILPKDKKLSDNEKAGIYSRAVKKIESIEKDLKRQVFRKEKKDRRPKKIKITSNFKKNRFEKIVEAAKAYIKNGDIIQVVLSQRFKAPLGKGHFEIYRELRSSNPSPYMFYLKLKDIIFCGSSPEVLVRCEEDVIVMRPIAGTKPRGLTDEEDRQREKELLSDKKERAEHLMLVDLGRNDLGRVSKSGSVEITEFMTVERYSHVMHLVSEVKGILDNKKYDIYDVLRSAFPAGTVTGSPKIRAMEIIDELENIKRGPYAGCVGYFSFSGNMDTCITIRTIVIHKNIAYIQAGAGIVADSVPQNEYFESVNKAKALLEAIAK